MILEYQKYPFVKIQSKNIQTKKLTIGYFSNDDTFYPCNEAIEAVEKTIEA
jgi:hypothetical protein